MKTRSILLKKKEKKKSLKKPKPIEIRPLFKLFKITEADNLKKKRVENPCFVWENPLLSEETNPPIEFLIENRGSSKENFSDTNSYCKATHD